MFNDNNNKWHTLKFVKINNANVCKINEIR